MICSVVHLDLGLGSSIARIKGRHCLGERLAIVGGVAATAELEELQALAYAAYRESDVCATRQGISWKWRQ